MHRIYWTREDRDDEAQPGSRRANFELVINLKTAKALGLLGRIKTECYKGPVWIKVSKRLASLPGRSHIAAGILAAMARTRSADATAVPIGSTGRHAMWKS
jgi:hypothetical protein